MEQLIDFARGPLFIASISLMLLGIGRIVFLRFFSSALSLVAEIKAKKQRPKLDIGRIIKSIAADKPGPIAVATAAIGSVFLFVVVVFPLFLAEHVILWRRLTTLEWLVFKRDVADAITLTAILVCAALIVLKALDNYRKKSGSWKDYALLLVAGLPFIGGYISMHPQYLFASMESTMMMHVLSAELLFVLIPFTRLSNVVKVVTEKILCGVYIPEAAEKKEEFRSSAGEERVGS